MDALSHYRRGAQILADKDVLAAYYPGGLATVAALANAHALLSLAGVTALRGTHPVGTLPAADADAWFDAASREEPIPSETDDEPGPHWCCARGPACIECSTGIAVGSVSPTDPAELGPWLLALPHRSILAGADGYPYQRDTGSETIHRAPDREFPALVSLGGRPMELTEGTNDVLGLAESCAPFTVLALGPSQTGA